MNENRIVLRKKSDLDPKPDKQVLIDLIKIRMPYGKYQNRLLCDIPLNYLVWMNQKDAFPKGKIGFLLKNLLEIKTNELEPILWKLKELYK